MTNSAEEFDNDEIQRNDEIHPSDGDTAVDLTIKEEALAAR